MSSPLRPLVYAAVSARFLEPKFKVDVTRLVTLAAPLSDGARMIWERDPGPLASNQLLWFRFRVEDAAG